MEKIFETPGTVRLHVQNEVGLVAVTATRTEETVVWLEAHTPGAEELVERATVECRPSGRRHLVVVKVPKQGLGGRFIRRNPVTVRVDLPEGSDVTVATGSADVEVTGPIGAADFTTASGDVVADDVAANLTARSASGGLTVGAVGGDLKVQTASGDLRCSSVAIANSRVQVSWNSALPSDWYCLIRHVVGAAAICEAAGCDTKP